jgi:dTDP-4-dehydrorhamnose reductase
LNPVFIEDIAQIILAAGRRKLNGVYHLGTRQVFSRFELNRFVAAAIGCDISLVRPVRMSDNNFSEPRPLHNTLACQKIERALDFQFTEIAEITTELVVSNSPSRASTSQLQCGADGELRRLGSKN